MLRKLRLIGINFYVNSDRKVIVSLIYLLLLFVMSMILPLFSSLDPNSFDPNSILEPIPPSFTHWFGTDDFGRDMLLRIIDGARISLMVGLVSVGIAMIVGLLIGIVAGYKGGRVDDILMRMVDLFLAVPTLFLILTIQVLLTPSIVNVMIVIGLTSWMGIARLVRAEVMSVKERPFIIAARARSISEFVLIIKHMLPHTLTPIIVAAMLGMGGAILTESVLSFLGLGVQPPDASWGNMLQNSLSFIQDAPWMTIVPGGFITGTVLALNFLGDGLRTYLNPGEKNA